MKRKRLRRNRRTYLDAWLSRWRARARRR